MGDACAATASSPCDQACYNVWTLLGTWQFFTPEFQLVCVLISTPLALLVALWGMTNERTIMLMSSRRENGSTEAVEIGRLAGATQLSRSRGSGL